MSWLAIAALSSLLLTTLSTSVGAQSRFIFSGGPTGVPSFGFQGGWGMTIGFERRVAACGAFVVRLDGGAIPSNRVPPAGEDAIGEGGYGSKDAALVALMAGLRLKPNDVSGPYLDLLLGVGYLDDPFSDSFAARTRSNTNVALSIGPGIEVRVGRALSVFGHVHLDFYSVDGVETPLIPVRLGVIVP